MMSCLAACAKFRVTRQKLAHLLDELGGDLCKALAGAALVLYLILILLSNRTSGSKFFSSLLFKQQHRVDSHSTTNVSHLVFAIASSSNSWKVKGAYTEAWWRPNVTRGLLWLDRAPTEQLPWSPSFPPYRVSEDVTRIKEYAKHGLPHLIQMARMLLETYREFNKGVRWYVIADDDTIFFVDNLVEILARYDHNKYFYIGQSSESVRSNCDYSFHMAFGGAGYALSFPLAVALAKNADLCINRYQNLHTSDHIVHSCVADLGVNLTPERGFHQVDLHGDLSGFLSAHPPVPCISLHHLDQANPIFPFMNRHQSLNHLMKAVTIDPSRSLQQTICYHKQNNWSFSISWGYSAYIYEHIHPPSFLERPLETFIPWRHTGPFMFNTRFLSKNPCEMPHLFFFDSIEQADASHIVTSYMRRWPRNLPTCLLSGSHPADSIVKIRVFSPITRLGWVGRRECCDIVGIYDQNVTDVKIRSCMKDEMVE